MSDQRTAPGKGKEAYKERMSEISRVLEKAGARPDLLPGTISYYDYEISKYPDRIRVSFADGKTLVYELRQDQPAPVILENIKIIRKWKTGYVNHPEKARRRRKA